MLSKNNYKEELKKMEPRNDHFSIRKLTVGTVSVLLGWTLINWSDTPVKADTTNSKPDKNLEVKTDPNVVNESSSQIKKVKVEVETPKTAAKSNTENQNTTPQTNQAVSQEKSTQKVTNSNPSQEKQTTSVQPAQSQVSNSSNLQQTKPNTQVKAQSAQPSTTNQVNVSQAKQQTAQAANNADLIKQAKINTANKIQTNNTQQVKETQLNIDKGALAGATTANLTNKENKVSAVTPNKIADEVQATDTAVDLKNVTPEFNVRNEADNYDLGVTVQKGQVIYGQVYIKNQNKYVTWATDQDNLVKTCITTPQRE